MRRTVGRVKTVDIAASGLPFRRIGIPGNQCTRERVVEHNRRPCTDEARDLTVRCVFGESEDIGTVSPETVDMPMRDVDSTASP